MYVPPLLTSQFNAHVLKQHVTWLRSGHGLIICHHHLGELCTLLRVSPHDISEQEDIVWGIANLLGVEDDLLELTSLSKALDHLMTQQQDDS